MARRTRSTDDPRRHRAQGERKPLPSSSSSPPLPPPRRAIRVWRSLADACVTLFLYVLFDPAAAPLRCYLSLPLSYAPSVTFYPPRCSLRCNGLLVSLSFDFWIRIQRKSATLLSRRSYFVFHLVFSSSPLYPSYLPTSVSCTPDPFQSLCIFHSTTCAALPPSCTPAAFVPLPAALSRSRVNELTC